MAIMPLHGNVKFGILQYEIELSIHELFTVSRPSREKSVQRVLALTMSTARSIRARQKFKPDMLPKYLNTHLSGTVLHRYSVNMSE